MGAANETQSIMGKNTGGKEARDKRKVMEDGRYVGRKCRSLA